MSSLQLALAFGIGPASLLSADTVASTDATTKCRTRRWVWTRSTRRSTARRRGDSAREARLWKLAAGVSAAAAVFGARRAGGGRRRGAGGAARFGAAAARRREPEDVRAGAHLRRPAHAEGGTRLMKHKDVADLLGRVQVAQAHEEKLRLRGHPAACRATRATSTSSRATRRTWWSCRAAGCASSASSPTSRTRSYGGVERHDERLRHAARAAKGGRRRGDVAPQRPLPVRLRRGAPQGAEGTAVAGGVAQRLLRLRRRVDGRVPAAGRLPVPVRPVLPPELDFEHFSPQHTWWCPQLAVGPQPQPVRRRRSPARHRALRTCRAAPIADAAARLRYVGLGRSSTPQGGYCRTTLAGQARRGASG